MREASPTDFPLEVEGVGEFVFARRTVRDRFRIGAMHNRLTDGSVNDPTSPFSIVAEAFATLSVLMVSCPPGFEDRLDLARDDTDAEENEEVILKVFFALRAKEDAGRKDAEKSGEGAGEAAT